MMVSFDVQITVLFIGKLSSTLSTLELFLGATLILQMAVEIVSPGVGLSTILTGKGL